MVFVVAHEVGHHIAGHLDFRGQNHQVEFEADRYAGFILGRMGASYDQTLSAVRIIAGAKETTTHPPQQQRVQAAALGWSDGRDPKGDSTDDQKGGPNAAAVKPPATIESTPKDLKKKGASQASCKQMEAKYNAAARSAGAMGTLKPLLEMYHYLQCNCGHHPSPHLPACPK